MPNPPLPKQGSESGTQNVSVFDANDDEANLKRYVEIWPARLEAGFNAGSEFFAWLMIASRPKDEWPDWCGEYLVEIANRVLEHSRKMGTSLESIRKVDFSTHKAAYRFLGIKRYKKKWDQVKALFDERDMFSHDDPYLVAWQWANRVQYSRRELLRHLEVEDEIQARVDEIVEEKSTSRLAALGMVAEQGVEIYPGKMSRYKSEEALRLALKRRRKKLEELLKLSDPLSQSAAPTKVK